jgi:esterase/lipase superfamily enzyme
MAFGFSFGYSIQTILAYADDETKKQPYLLSVFSTRTIRNYNQTQIEQQVDYTLAKFNGTCPSDIAIYIHGFNKTKDDAGEEFNRIEESFAYNNYSIPLVGFSWISNTGWNYSKEMAIKSGIELAKFITEIEKESNCPNMNIHIIAYSLGALVVDSTLVTLNNSSNMNTKIASVHLLGAAISNTMVGNNTPLGNAIERIVFKFYNLYNPEDEGLKFNKKFEHHNPLGLIGAPNGTVHFNYQDINVTHEIPPFSDADGDGNSEECFEEFNPAIGEGDNHCGYIGFRAPFSPSIINDGVINVIVGHWKES